MIPPVSNYSYIPEVKDYKKNNNEPKEKEEVKEDEVKPQPQITGWPPHVHFGD